MQCTVSNLGRFSHRRVYGLWIGILIKFSFGNKAGSRRVKLKCPPGAKSGQSLAITVPVEKTDEKKLNQLNGPNVNAIPKSDPQGKAFYIGPLSYINLNISTTFFCNHSSSDQCIISLP